MIILNNMEPQVNCPNCKQTILVQDYFCPNCGKKIKDKPQSTTVLRQILVYLLSFSLPPLGLWPAVKYLRQKDEKSRMIGFVALALTIISIGITIWFSMAIMNVLNQQINQQLNGSLNLSL
jgi:hypothetical protein